MSKLLLPGILQQQSNQLTPVAGGDYDGTSFGFYSATFAAMGTYYQENVADGDGYIVIEMYSSYYDLELRVYLNDVLQMTLNNSTGTPVVAELLINSGDVLKCWMQGGYYTDGNFNILRGRYEGSWWLNEVLDYFTFSDYD